MELGWEHRTPVGGWGRGRSPVFFLPVWSNARWNLKFRKSSFNKATTDLVPKSQNSGWRRAQAGRSKEFKDKEEEEQTILQLL